MDILSFEWDPVKASINKVKHGVTFEEAETAFYDEAALVIDDSAHSIREDRFILIGMSISAKILVVCHCLRQDDTIIRIISARKATTREIKQYQEKGKSL